MTDASTVSSDPAYPVELGAPDIEPYREGNRGVPFVTTFDSGREGPHVAVAALTHGNELCGAIVLDFLFRERVRPTRGKLTLFVVNHMAYARFDPANPGASRFVDEDINRVWSGEVLGGRRVSTELKRARELRSIVDEVDLLLDLHSMQQRNVPLMLAGPLPKGRELAQAVGYPAHIVVDAGHAAGKRMRDYAGFGDRRSKKNALLLEAGQHWESATADVALEATLRFLDSLDAIDRDFARSHMRDDAEPQAVIEVVEAVTIETDAFRFVRPFVGMEVIAEEGTIIGYDGDDAILTPCDDCVLIMPSRRLLRGQTAVRLGRFLS